MAEVLHNTVSLNGALARPRSVQSVSGLRTALGLVVLLGAITFFLGTSWDIQWHTFIGRDRTLIPPHVMMLCGVTICGLAALLAVLIETAWVRRDRTLAQYSTDFADRFHGSLGAYIAGFGALNTAVAFPLDSYWHALYGIDVAIWAPFHIMLIMGMAISTLGSMYMLSSASHLADLSATPRVGRLASSGTLVALATLLCILTFLTFDALGDMGTFTLLGVSINVFPLVNGALVAWIFAAAVSSVPGRWTATKVAGLSLLFVVLVAAFVPPAMNILMSIEHLTFRPRGDGGLIGPQTAAVALEWPIISLAVALVFDVLVRRARRKNWSDRRLWIVLPLAAIIGGIPLVPLVFITIEYLGGLGFGFIPSLLIGLLGTFIGTWLGRGMGDVLHVLER